MITEIVNKLKVAAQSYYEGNPIMSDEAFDALVNQLKQEDPTNTILTTIGWGYELPKNKKYTHKYGLVGSLSKIHSVSEVSTKINNIIVTPKFDGSTCVAYYEKGKLVRALSRGNGQVGVDKTAKYASIVRKYNLIIPDTFTGAIRGEIVFSFENWNKYKKKYPNAKFPRNISTGLFMSDEISEDLSFIDFMAYKIIGEEEQCSFTSYSSMLVALREYHFPKVDFSEILTTDITDAMCKWLFDELNKNFPIDGLVFNSGISYNNNYYSFQDIAYKFQAESKLTTVKDIEWSLSKNNLLIPVLRIAETELSGASVNRVTAYNAQYIRDNDIGVGTQLLVQRSGEVIPKVVEVVSPTCAELPETCPVCGEQLSWDGVHLICNNATCSNIKFSQLREWITLIGCNNILGVGESVLLDFIKYFKLTSVDSIYSITYMYDDSLTEHQLHLYKQIVSNLFTEITPSQALQAMNIRGIGKEVSDKIADIIYDNINDIDLIKEKVQNISGIGAAVANTIENWFYRISRVFGYAIVKPSQNLNLKVKQGINVVVTGSVSMSRKQFIQYLAEHNINLIENITKADVLICNEVSTSNKYVTAQKLNIPIMNENQFKEKYIV